MLRFRLAAPPGEPWSSLPARPRSARRARPPRSRSSSRSTRTSRSEPSRPAAYVVQRAGKVKDVGVADGEARPKGADQLAFGTPPQVGDALYLGFDHPLERLLRADRRRRLAGARRRRRPGGPAAALGGLVGDGDWAEATCWWTPPAASTTAPAWSSCSGPPQSAMERSAATARTGCAAGSTTRRARRRRDAPTRTRPRSTRSRPRRSARGCPPSTPREAVEDRSARATARPARRHPLRHDPMLSRRQGEKLQVLDPESGDWETWELRRVVRRERPERPALRARPRRRARSSSARRSARPTAAGTQYGAVPPKGAITALHALPPRRRPPRQRHGRHADQLKSSIPGVATVTNPDPALGGVDAESLESARQRAAMEIRTRYRAVTAEDFEFLAGEASPRVARAVCIPPDDGGPCGCTCCRASTRPTGGSRTRSSCPRRSCCRRGRRVPRRAAADRHDGRAAAGRFRGVSVVVNLQAAPLSDLARVEEEVAHALYTYLNPLVGGSSSRAGRRAGSSGARSTRASCTASSTRSTGVEFVKILRVYETDLATDEQNSQAGGQRTSRSSRTS